jgi:hypothetical protein
MRLICFINQSDAFDVSLTNQMRLICFINQLDAFDMFQLTNQMRTKLVRDSESQI